MPRPSIGFLLTIPVGLAVTAACGGGSAHSSHTNAMSNMTTPPSSAVVTAPVATNAVSIHNFAFSPANIRVKTGTTVTWTNQDQDSHTVTANPGPFHSKALATGDKFKFTFTKAGTYHYLCTIHPFMVAVVVVTP